MNEWVPTQCELINGRKSSVWLESVASASEALQQIVSEQQKKQMLGNHLQRVSGTQTMVAMGVFLYQISTNINSMFPLFKCFSCNLRTAEMDSINLKFANVNSILQGYSGGVQRLLHVLANSLHPSERP